MMNSTLSSGVWPAMLTPLTPDKAIDWDALDHLIEWYLKAGVAGLFAIGLSSEMYDLSDDERPQLAKYVVDQVKGRVPVVATGNFGQSLDQQATTIKRLAATGVQAVTIVLANLAPQAETADDILKKNLESLLGMTGNIPLALYECPQPYHRLVSANLLRWAAQSGRFLLLKETSRSLASFQDKIQATTATPLKCLTADASTLLASLNSGGEGYCGIAANYYPQGLAWLCNHFKTQPDKAAQIQALLGAFDLAIHQKYPLAAKYFLQNNGLPITLTNRAPTPPLEDYDRRILDYMNEHLQTMTL
jgi:4-hydroxy-tetrahydrodipicolinate synthase